MFLLQRAAAQLALNELHDRQQVRVGPRHPQDDGVAVTKPGRQINRDNELLSHDRHAVPPRGCFKKQIFWVLFQYILFWNSEWSCKIMCITCSSGVGRYRDIWTCRSPWWPSWYTEPHTPPYWAHTYTHTHTQYIDTIWRQTSRVCPVRFRTLRSHVTPVCVCVTCVRWGRRIVPPWWRCGCSSRAPGELWGPCRLLARPVTRRTARLRSAHRWRRKHKEKVRRRGRSMVSHPPVWLFFDFTRMSHVFFPRQ